MNAVEEWVIYMVHSYDENEMKTATKSWGIESGNLYEIMKGGKEWSSIWGLQELDCYQQQFPFLMDHLTARLGYNQR